MISISCGGSESSNETAAPQENQSQESQAPETSEESPEAGEETPAPETEEKLEEQHPDWKIIPAVDEDGILMGVVAQKPTLKPYSNVPKGRRDHTKTDP